jgi:plastocyanin
MNTATMDSPQARRRELPWSWRGAILALVVAQFLFLHGLPWRAMFDWDAAILWTYAAIPVLVFLALIVRRELALLPWFIHTVEIAAAKFWITATVLLVFLMVRGDGGRVEATPFPRPVVATQPAVAGAAAPAEETTVAVTFDEGRGTVTPAFATVRIGDRVAVRSVDGGLHSARVTRADGSSVSNLAVRPSGETVFTIEEGAGEVVTLECAVHGAQEGRARLLILP